MAKTTRWLVSGGVLSFDGLGFPPLAIQAAIWLILMLSASAALALLRSDRSRRLWPVALLSGAALIVGCCGYFTPSFWWQPVIFCQTNGEGQLSLNLNTVFALPWLLGVLGLVTLICDRATLSCPGCRRPAISFRRIWLKSTFGTHRCPFCMAECQVEHPTWYWATGASLSVIILAGGFLWAGWTGLVVASSLAIALDAWFDYHMIQAFTLLKSVVEDKTVQQRV